MVWEHLNEDMEGHADQSDQWATTLSLHLHMFNVTESAIAAQRLAYADLPLAQRRKQKVQQ